MNILELIPQRPPVVMIDELLYSDDKKSFTHLFICEDNIFCNNGYFTEPGLLENMAQTAAAWLGVMNKSKNKEIQIGYIGAIRDLIINFLPEVNTEIFTEVVLENEVLGCRAVRGTVKSSDKIAVTCEMRIFLK